MELDLFGKVCEVTSYTIKGCRSDNQDSVAWFYRNEEDFTEEYSEGVLFSGRPGVPFFLGGVCDGMGGLKDGKLAGRMILSSIMDWGTGAEYHSLDEYVSAFGEKLVESENKLMDLFPGSGTTISMVLGTPYGWVTLHVGDSRTYAVGYDGSVFRTSDQTYVEQLFKKGAIEEDEMNTHPMNSRLESYIGGSDAGKLVRDDLKDWVSMAVCSDGAFGYISPSEFRELVAGDLNAKEMTNQAYNRGSTDNISVLRICAS